MSVRMPSGRFFGNYTALRTTPRLHLTETTYQPDLRLPRHCHENPYLCVVFAGGFEEQAIRRDHACTRGALIYNTAGESHQDHFGSHGARCLNIELHRLWVEQMRADELWPRDRVIYHTHESALTIVGRLEQELRSKDSASLLAIEGLVLQLLAELCRHRTTRRGAAPQWMKGAMELIRTRFCEPLTLADIAAEVGVHPAHLSRSFRARHGCTVGEFVRKLRADWAHVQIERSDLAIGQIAARAGFCDQSHMARVMRKQYGVSPSQLRKARSSAQF